MEGKLFAVVHSECDDDVVVGPESLYVCVSSQIKFGWSEVSRNQYFGFSSHRGNQGSLPSFPEDGVQFLVSDSGFLGNDQTPLAIADGVPESPNPAFGS